MKRDAPLVTIDNEEKFFQMTKAAFGQRRKTINNNYQSLFKMEKSTNNLLLNG